MAFENSEIKECAVWSLAAYSDDGWVGVAHATAISDPVTDCQCYVFTDPAMSKAFVVFRGTSSITDVLADCNVRLKAFHGGRVHAGFLRQVQAVMPRITEALKDWKGEVRCTGHSAGSSTSAIAAFLLAKEREGDHTRPVSHIGFGSPRVGDANWRLLFESLVTRSLRVKNSRDPICAVPEGGGYVHAGEEAHIGRPDPHPELPLMTNIADHDMTTGYQANLDHDDPTAKPEPFATYILMFLANHLARAAKR